MAVKTDLKVVWGLNQKRTWKDLADEDLKWGSFKLFDIKAKAEVDTTNSLVESSKTLVYTANNFLDFSNIKIDFNSINFESKAFVNFFALTSSGKYIERMKDYLPWYEKDDEVFLAILRAYDYGLRNLETGRQFLEMNLFVESMTDKVLGLWERDFGIKVNPSWTIQERQEMIRARWIFQFGQLTESKLREIISSFTNSECRLIKDYDQAILTVDFIGTVGRPKNLKAIDELLNTILPGVWTWEFKIRYSGWDEFTKKYRWQDLKPFEWLSLRTWDDKKKEKVRLRQEELDEANS